MRALAILSLALVAFFLLMPDADLAVSRLFFREGEGFIYAWNPVVRAVYVTVPYVSRLVLASLVLLALWHGCVRRGWLRSRWSPDMRALVFAALLLVLGPGLLVHAVMKDNFGRPRPVHVVEFGGNEPYIPPLHRGPGDGQSFVSGHAATGFFFAPLALMLRRKPWRIAGYGTGIAIGMGVGAVRIIQGGHFLSDILFAGAVVLLLGHILYRLIFGKLSNQKI